MLRSLLLILLLSTCVRAQLSLSGSVRDQASNDPLPGAYVYPKSDRARLVTAATDGTFALELAAPDTLIVSFLGYRELRQYVEHPGELELRLTAAARLKAITVKAQKVAHGELASERISQLNVYLNPAAKADPLLAVNSLPAATNVDETANVSLRGSPSAATGIYLNDVPIRNAVRLDQSNGVGQFSIFGQVPLTDVRIYPSHPPVSFTQTSAGAVGLYTSAALPARREYGISLSMAGLGLAHTRPLGKKSGLRAFLNYGNLSAFRAVNQQGLPELKRSRSLDVTAQFVHQFSERSTLQVFYLGFRESYRFLTRSPYYEGDFVQEKPRHLAVLNWRLKRERWTWKINHALDWERAEFSLGNVRTIPRRLSGHLAFHGRYEGAGFSLQTGSSFNGYADRTQGTFPLLDHRLRPEDPSGTYGTAVDHHLLETYVYGQFRLGERWLLGLGAKPVAELTAGEIRPSAQASFRFRPGERHRLTLGGGHFSQFLVPGPEVRQWQWLALRQLALEYRYQNAAWTLDAALYAKQENYALLEDVNVRGAEFRLGYDANAWKVWVSAGTVFSRSAVGAVPTRRDLPFLARTQVQKQLEGQWTLGLAATCRRGTYYNPVINRTPLADTEGWFSPVYGEAGTRYPNYARVDFSMSKILLLGEKTQLILFANVNNLLDAENVRSYTYDARFQERRAEVYSRRLVFIGGQLKW